LSGQFEQEKHILLKISVASNYTYIYQYSSLNRTVYMLLEIMSFWT